MLEPYIERCQEFGILPEGEWEVNWPDTFKLSPLERGLTSAQMARSATNLAKTLESSQSPISRQEARRMMWLPAEETDGETNPGAGDRGLDRQGAAGAPIGGDE